MAVASLTIQGAARLAWVLDACEEPYLTTMRILLK
jgi:hypothetical protein